MSHRKNSPYLRLLGLLAVLLLAVACAGPQTTRTGAVHDIRISEAPEPAELNVNPGDEVRWINMRTLPLRVDLVEVKPDDLACERGFSNLLGTIQESATINPNESASACFVKASTVKYNLRMESALPGGKSIVSGVVQVGVKS
jgi:plastocyanin